MGKRNLGHGSYTERNPKAIAAIIPKFRHICTLENTKWRPSFLDCFILQCLSNTPWRYFQFMSSLRASTSFRWPRFARHFNDDQLST